MLEPRTDPNTPLRGYRYERLVIVLVALAALPPISLAGPQDRTRYELTRQLVFHHTLQVPSYLFDRAVYNGKSYSDKAPGISFMAVPAFHLERVAGIAKSPRSWTPEGDLSLWLMRFLTSGILFLASVVVVGRLAERLVPRSGAVTAAIFGVATLAAPLGPTMFEHDAAAAFAIAGFALLWTGRRGSALVLAGVTAGTAVLFQYSTALLVLLLALYGFWRHGRRILWFVLGGVPPALALGAYNWVAFDSPFRLSYRYVYNAYTEQQRSGFFGIGVPSLDGLREVFFGPRGLLWFSPVCAAAVVGLWLLWRRGGRAEALLAATVLVLFVLIDAGYFLPYGGGTPGPRFLVPALPFLMLGLPRALSRFPIPTLLLGAVSAVWMTVDALSWGVRREEDRAFVPGKNDVMSTVWSVLGLHRDLGAVLVLAAALAAVTVGTVAWARR